MNKATAHMILGLFDIAAVPACYYVFSEWQNINQLINDNTESISFQRYFGLYALMVMVPITHSTSLFKWQGTAKKIANNALIVSMLLIIIGVFVLDSNTNNKLTNAGYRYCESQSKTMRFSEFRTYLKEHQSCPE